MQNGSHSSLTEPAGMTAWQAESKAATRFDQTASRVQVECGCSFYLSCVYRAFYIKSRVHHIRFLGVFGKWKKETFDVLRARGILFWPNIAREPTKINETKAIRSEIARGIRFDRSQGLEIYKMVVFSIFTKLEVALQVPRHGVQFLIFLGVIFMKSTQFGNILTFRASFS